MTGSEAGWQPDPTGRHEHRYWDGSKWTDNVADAGVSATDPYDAVSDAPTTVEPAVNPYEAPVSSTPDAPAAWGDPTQATPAADPTAAFSTPAPPVPPTYAAATAPVDGDGSGGSKKGFLIGLGVLVAVALAVVAFLALGGDDDDDGDLASNRDTTTTVDDDDDDTTTTTEDDSDSTTTTFDLDDEDLFTDMGDMDDLDDLGDIGDLPEDFEEMLADIYEDMLNLDRPKAECLADRLGAAVRDGGMTEEQAFSDFMDYMSDCNISMEELAGN